MQKSPQSDVEWTALRLSGSDSLAARASKKLKNDELLVPVFAGTRLRMELDKIPLWRGEFVSVRQLCDDFARYLYLPRLSDSSVLLAAVEDGMGLLTWEQESFAYDGVRYMLRHNSVCEEEIKKSRRDFVKKLLEAANSQLPDVLPYRGVKVTTKKNLAYRRKTS